MEAQRCETMESQERCVFICMLKKHPVFLVVMKNNR